jgi:hypothetical protein
MDVSNGRCITLATKWRKIKIAKWGTKKIFKKITAVLSFLLLQMRRSQTSTIIY